MPTQQEVDELFLQHFRRGGILRFEMPCDDPNRQVRNKFGVILNKDHGESCAFLAITTSKTSYFSSAFVENDIVRLRGGSYPCFPLDTIVSLRKIEQYGVAWLKGLCSLRKATFQGKLSSADMTEIDQKLANSNLIEGNVLVRLL
jgi:hypothetical protein